MVRKLALFSIASAALTIGLWNENPAHGQISPVGSEQCKLEGALAEALSPATKAVVPSANPSKSDSAKRRDFKRFRPIAREDFLSGLALESRTSIENIFDKELTKKLQAKYQESVAPLERRAEDPYRRASHSEMDRYFESRREMAKWTAREVLNQQFKDILRKGDRDSAPLMVISAMKDFSGSAQQEKHLSQDEKIARAHRLDLASHQEEEEVIPTRLKTKLNLIYGRGQLNFSNPIVHTALNLDVSKANESVSVDMNKDFKKLALNTSATYGLEKKRLVFRVSKKLVERVYLDLNSERNTANNSSGNRSNETAKITYSLSF